jgi:Zn-dependent protease
MLERMSDSMPSESSVPEPTSRLPDPLLPFEPSTGRLHDAAVPRLLWHRAPTATRYGSPRKRKVRLPLTLFVATCASTFWAGASHWSPDLLLSDPARAGVLIAENWTGGVQYMAAVILILLMHEMGHFLQTVRYGVPASLPIFIPFPIMLTGTMGAVIGMEGSRADRKQLFDIGLTGPWAGLVAALPIVWFGINSGVVAEPGPASYHLGEPLVFKLLTWHLRPELPPNAELAMNPLLMAGWVGMLITGLNMLPVSQLDGGHVIYGLFGRRAHWIARGFVLASIMAMIIADYYQWVVMLVLVLALGVDHPPSRDDTVPLGWARRAIGLVSLMIPVFCFTPQII